jgi:anti-anti-sigma factor
MGNYPEKIFAGHLELEIRTDSSAVIVKCVGRLTSENAVVLKSQVRSMIPVEKRIVLDLTDMIGMDSSGLGTIVGALCFGEACEVRVAVGEFEQEGAGVVGLE